MRITICMPSTSTGSTNATRNVVSSTYFVEQHCSELARADLILFSTQRWVSLRPFSRWIDRCFRPTLHTPIPLELGSKVFLLVFSEPGMRSSVTRPIRHERETTAFGDPLETLWKNCVFGLCRVSSVMRRMYAPVSGSTVSNAPHAF